MIMVRCSNGLSACVSHSVGRVARVRIRPFNNVMTYSDSCFRAGDKNKINVVVTDCIRGIMDFWYFLCRIFMNSILGRVVYSLWWGIVHERVRNESNMMTDGTHSLSIHQILGSQAVSVEWINNNPFTSVRKTNWLKSQNRMVIRDIRESVEWMTMTTMRSCRLENQKIIGAELQD